MAEFDLRVAADDITLKGVANKRLVLFIGTSVIDRLHRFSG